MKTAELKALMIKDVKLYKSVAELNALLDKVIEHGMHGHLKGSEQILAIEVIEAEIKNREVAA